MPAPTPRKPEKPVLWIIAGPNGSGKSTSYNRTDIEGWGGSVWIVNPDLLTARLIESEKLGLHAANVMALNRIEAWLTSSVEVHQTIGVETVLSTGKYRELVRFARSRGFAIRLMYVVLRDVEMQLRRIAQRVSEGGHDVPAAKVRKRRGRSLRQLLWFARNADQFYVIDNSTSETKMLVSSEMAADAVFASGWPADLRMLLMRLGLTPGAALHACQQRRKR